ncbi:hypothetical protein MIR68_006884 [Amoeboaphelidium protococcarum]|nr:hypothetical protein MIR68_006884 [Amoeboaphelidium protococcarum]
MYKRYFWTCFITFVILISHISAGLCLSKGVDERYSEDTPTEYRECNSQEEQSDFFALIRPSAERIAKLAVKTALTSDLQVVDDIRSVDINNSLIYAAFLITSESEGERVELGRLQEFERELYVALASQLGEIQLRPEYMEMGDANFDILRDKLLNKITSIVKEFKYIVK